MAGRKKSNNRYTERLNIPLTVEQKRRLVRYIAETGQEGDLAPIVRGWIMKWVEQYEQRGMLQTIETPGEYPLYREVEEQEYADP